MKIKNKVLANSCAAVLIALLLRGLCSITLWLTWEEGSDNMPGTMGVLIWVFLWLAFCAWYTAGATAAAVRQRKTDAGMNWITGVSLAAAWIVTLVPLLVLIYVFTMWDFLEPVVEFIF